jgi:ABC-type polysaccharide/polyol phosphate transport system ATPase subunit
MRERSEVFRLERVGVDFRLGAIHERSLKHALARLLRRSSRPLHHALADLSLAVRAGEHVGVLGRNGAGKSTLLRVLARVITPQRGAVHVARGLRVAPLLELGIGFQPDLSGIENCHLAGALMGYSYREIALRLPRILEFAELDGFAREPLRSYSSGMHARLAFALATDIEPDVLLVDEVFGVGDEFFMRKCAARFRRLMEAGTTTVLVSHDLDFLSHYCSRMLWLDGGRLVMDGDPAAVSRAYRERGGRASAPAA